MEQVVTFFDPAINALTRYTYQVDPQHDCPQCIEGDCVQRVEEYDNAKLVIHMRPKELN